MKIPRKFIARREWTPEEDGLLKRLTADGKTGYNEMVPFFVNRTKAALICRANQHLGITNAYQYHKWEYDKTFFLNPNPINSYVAGFLAADGCIVVRPNNHGFCLVLELANEDLHHLEKIKSLLKYEGPTIQRNTGRSHYFKMTISKEFKDSLDKNFGVIERKSRRLSPPHHLPWDCKFAYLVGLMDGDGCVHVNKKNQMSVRLASCSLACVSWVKEQIDFLRLPTIRFFGGPNVGHSTKVDAHHICYNGSAAIGFVKLTKEFSRLFGLPVLDRKWNADKVSNCLISFCDRNPDYHFDPSEKLDSLLNPSFFSCIPITNSIQEKR